MYTSEFTDLLEALGLEPKALVLNKEEHKRLAQEVFIGSVKLFLVGDAVFHIPTVERLRTQDNLVENARTLDILKELTDTDRQDSS